VNVEPTAPRPAPRFSVVVPLYNTASWLLEETVASVVAQTWEDWELLLVDDHSPDRSTVTRAEALAADDPRITLIALPENLGISGATNAGFAAAAGEFIALLDHDDLITPDALAAFEERLAADEKIDYAYSDQDLLSADGTVRFGDFRKPAWSPERFLGQMYTSHLSVFRRSLLEQTGTLRSDFDGSQDHDLFLRISEVARRIANIPEVLYHWRAIEGSTAQDGNAKFYAWEAGRAAVAEACARRAIDADVELGPTFGTFRPMRRGTLAETSIIIVLDGPASGLAETVRSWQDDTPGEVLVVATHDSTAADRDDLRAAGAEVVRLSDRPHRVSILQAGALRASGAMLLFLDRDVRTGVDPIRQLAAVASEEGVGLVGGRLDQAGTIVHAGYRWRTDAARHAYRGGPKEHSGHYGDLLVNREVSAVSTRFASISRERFLALGGLHQDVDEFSADLDLAMKVRSTGERVIILASAAATVSEAFDEPIGPAGTALIASRWGWPTTDPFLR
jgi:GT2 family glycosyltransferase